jgi:hypothetical protein
MLKINDEVIEKYAEYLREREKTEATLEKYIHNIRKLSDYCGGYVGAKTVILKYKEI